MKQVEAYNKGEVKLFEFDCPNCGSETDGSNKAVKQKELGEILIYDDLLVCLHCGHNFRFKEVK